VLLAAAPAGADPAKPGRYTSTVLRIEPAVSGVSVEVVGGDGFLELKVDRGHEVTVQGYDQGPWLHVRPDGTVEENQRSPATYQNASRYGSTAPPDVTPETERNEPPDYKQVASDGTFAWHDHRIHWMSPQPPPGAHEGDVIFPDWQVPMTVDGTDVVVHGRLVLEKSISPIPWFGLAVLLAVALIAAGRGKSTFVATVALVVASALALQIGIVAYRSIPPAAGPNNLEIILPAIATVAALAALVLHRRSFGVVAALASVATLSGWAFMRFSVLFEPVLPTDVPFNLDRGATAAALGCSVAAAVLAVRSGALVLKLPDFGIDDDADDRGE
jgi:hypothetical protein